MFSRTVVFKQMSGLKENMFFVGGLYLDWILSPSTKLLTSMISDYTGHFEAAQQGINTRQTPSNIIIHLESFLETMLMTALRLNQTVKDAGCKTKTIN